MEKPTYEELARQLRGMALLGRTALELLEQEGIDASVRLRAVNARTGESRVVADIPMIDAIKRSEEMVAASGIGS